jgi:Nitroreductase
MNETLKVISERYSCRDYTDQPLTDEQIKAIGMAGLAAPSAMNGQPWQIIVVSDKALIDEMDAAGMKFFSEQDDKGTYNRMMERGGKLFYNAACMVVIAIRPGAGLDCGIACENVALAASSMGLGNVICGLAGAVFSGDSGKKYMGKLSFPEGYVFGMAVLVGNPVADGKPHPINENKVTYIK